ncbi:uncharacterized protein MYCFIDRAFT_174453 [Pseudocercospora fijiensis CIRAD86]|uniref:Uncharacterized protein n=1 Tax=Pseudocercospora fijiensis (strain CIRAD86) TaxID=383855 RepID=M3B0H7_PSEFD|nr:uncharacterized protein MYCFIDRAFT_174453 [Pseudocercospora fijiensis CIRAD86]EME82947.1 hypothetical protein MYCFIDRAFT_174453 [Pseudocercospora fijiensis CIRAD86]
MLLEDLLPRVTCAAKSHVTSAMPSTSDILIIMCVPCQVRRVIKLAMTRWTRPHFAFAELFLLSCLALLGPHVYATEEDRSACLLGASLSRIVSCPFILRASASLAPSLVSARRRETCASLASPSVSVVPSAWRACTTRSTPRTPASWNMTLAPIQNHLHSPPLCSNFFPSHHHGPTTTAARSGPSSAKAPAIPHPKIYKLALDGVVIHILPPNTVEERKIPHALTRTSRQVRNEVLPLIHSLCPIRCAVTDFNFDGLLLWMSRVPPHEERNLKKNHHLVIRFNTSNQPQRSMESLRKWLHMRADVHRPQPKWHYTGAIPSNKVCADLRRRCKRMKEYGKQWEMLQILKALQITPLPTPLPGPGTPPPEENPDHPNHQQWLQQQEREQGSTHALFWQAVPTYDHSFPRSCRSRVRTRVKSASGLGEGSYLPSSLDYPSCTSFRSPIRTFAPPSSASSDDYNLMLDWKGLDWAIFLHCGRSWRWEAEFGNQRFTNVMIFPSSLET